MKKDIIIVTGGAGFVGSNLIENFIKKTKYKIISIDNYSSGFRKNHINNLRVKYIKGHTKDIEREEEACCEDKRDNSATPALVALVSCF